MSKKILWGFATFFCGSMFFAGITAVFTDGGMSNFTVTVIFAFLTWLCVKKTKGGRLRPESRKYNPGDPLPVVSSGTLFLSAGEVCHANEIAKSGKFKTVTTGYTGGSSGVSVRIAKGVTLRSGSSRGTPIRKNVLDTSNGTLYITNKRIVMISSKYGFDKHLSSISGIKMYSDGFSIQVGSSSYLILVKEPIYVASILIGATYST